MIYIDSDIYSFNLDEALTQISAQRRDQALRFSHEAGRRQRVAAYLLLKKGLEAEYGITENVEFGYAEGGKPFIKGHETIHFNLSHCRTAVACAIHDRPVGIDIETVRPFKESLARHVLSLSEYEKAIASADPAYEFTRLWTMKESLLKLTGRGLRADLRSLLPRSGVKFIPVDTGEAKVVCTVCLNEE